jgi:hypothetical protein
MQSFSGDSSLDYASMAEECGFKALGSCLLIRDSRLSAKVRGQSSLLEVFCCETRNPGSKETGQARGNEGWVHVFVIIEMM